VVAMDREAIDELFVQFGPVRVRRMFGGAGIWADGTMFGLIVDHVIYLKADDAIIPNFERERMGPFVYATKNGSRSLQSYWRMPDRLYDDPDELALWARRSLEAARRAATWRQRPGIARRKIRRTR
jgi:DNA transformation protein and related proteins